MLRYYFAEALVTNPKLLEKLLSFSQCKMVFIIVKIVSNLTILKDWFGCKYNDTNNLLELYNDSSSRAIDKGAPIAQSARICALAWRSLILFVFIVVEKIIFKLQKISIQSVTCVCLVKKNICLKRGRMAGKEMLNELFESCLFSKANVFGPLHDNTIKLTIGTSQVFCPVLVLSAFINVVDVLLVLSCCGSSNAYMKD